MPGLPMTAEGFEVEVVFAEAKRQDLRRVRVTEGCTAQQAIEQSGLSQAWLETGEGPRPLARFGRLIAPDTLLSAGDRVEILRPLLADPKDQRRQRAKRSARLRRGR